jgi:hypothetical protein
MKPYQLVISKSIKADKVIIHQCRVGKSKIIIMPQCRAGKTIK